MFMIEKLMLQLFSFEFIYFWGQPLALSLGRFLLHFGNKNYKKPLK